ncbi:unnamed protein product, partial [Strongylus vulgaris]
QKSQQINITKLYKIINQCQNAQSYYDSLKPAKAKSTKKAWELLHFLNGTGVPDETFWATLTGNSKKFSVPGGANGEEWTKFRDKYQKNHFKELQDYQKSKQKDDKLNYYLARHQVWYGNCGGELTSDKKLKMMVVKTVRKSFKTAYIYRYSGRIATGSCVFGVDDLNNILRQPHLIVYKMYLDFQPAAFFFVF